MISALQTKNKTLKMSSDFAVTSFMETIADVVSPEPQKRKSTVDLEGQPTIIRVNDSMDCFLSLRLP